jgi:hypothetical protein
VACFSDPVFQEVRKLVDELLRPLSEEDWQQTKCFNLVFGIACDPSPSGYPYDFTGKIWCPACGSENESYGPEASPQIENMELPYITHNAWQQLSEMEKRARIREALQKVGCLP